MIKKKNKKSLIKRILAFTGAIFCAIVCAFSIFNISENKSMEVCADGYEDASISFVGSDLWFPYDNVQFSLDEYDEDEDHYNLEYRSSIDYSNVSMPSDWLTFNLNVSFFKGVDNELYLNYVIPSFQNSQIYSYAICPEFGNVFDVEENKNVLKVSDIDDCFVVFLYPNSINGILSFFRVSDDFDYTDVIGVDIWATETDSYGKYAYVSYIDSYNKYFRICFYVADNFNLNRRTYYFSSSLNLTDNQYYQQGYTAGQSSGYNTGYSQGETKGYSDGYSAGQSFGYNSGYEAGLEDSNEYTFLSLVSSVIDAPMLYFTNLFNFELLGVNLQGFLMALFTLCVIVTLVKLCMGG